MANSTSHEIALIMKNRSCFAKVYNHEHTIAFLVAVVIVVCIRLKMASMNSTVSLQTLVPSLESLHHGRAVDTRQEHDAQEHSFQNANKAGEHSKENVVEKEKVRHDRKQPSVTGKSK